MKKVFMTLMCLVGSILGIMYISTSISREYIRNVDIKANSIAAQKEALQSMLENKALSESRLRVGSTVDGQVETERVEAIVDKQAEAKRIEAERIEGEKQKELLAIESRNNEVVPKENLNNESNIVTAPRVQQNNSQNNTYISADEAKSIMLGKVPGGIFIKFEADLYDYKPEYEGEMIVGDLEYEITVNAITGNITEYSVESRWDD